MAKKRAAFVTAILMLSLSCGRANDWPQWLGPLRNGEAPKETNLVAWPKEGPRLLWRQPVGQGFSSPIVQGQNVILCHRDGNRERVSCYQAQSGKGQWQFDYPTAYVDDFGFDEGPRATPAISEDRLYTFSADGVLHCLKVADGTQLWRVETQKTFGAGKGFFGLACSPLVEGRLVLINLGGRDGAGIVAFDKASGEVAWKATRSEASYSSPVMGVFGEKRYALFFNRDGLVALDPSTGQVRFEFPWRPAIQASVNAATPLVVGDRIFISTCYGRGAVLLRFRDDAPEQIWAGDDSLSNHYATSVHHEGFLYGFHGRQEQGCVLRCVALDTGKVRWSEPGLGSGSIIVAGDRLLVLTEKGELILAPASPEGFKPIARAQVLGFETRASPALADGVVYARDKRQLISLDLSGTRTP